MDQEKIRDYTGPPHPEHLTFENQTLVHMLFYTVCPLARMNIDKSILDVLRNTIYAISKWYIFDVEGMFLRILKDSSQYISFLPQSFRAMDPESRWSRYAHSVSSKAKS